MPRSTPPKSSRKTSTKSTNTGKGGYEVIELLKEDHDKVRVLFDRFEKLKKKNMQDDDSKQVLVETACAELTIHTQVEEEIFYPALREALDDDAMLDEAEVEHATVKQLISELSAMQPGDDLYDAKFTVLGEYVKHHLDEEEKEMFPKAKKEKVNLQGMAEEVMRRKMELREELGLRSEHEEEEKLHNRAQRHLH